MDDAAGGAVDCSTTVEEMEKGGKFGSACSPLAPDVVAPEQLTTAEKPRRHNARATRSTIKSTTMSKIPVRADPHHDKTCPDNSNRSSSVGDSDEELIHGIRGALTLDDDDD